MRGGRRQVKEEGPPSSQPLACKQRRDTSRHKPPHTRKNIFIKLSVNDVRYGSLSTKGKVMHHFRTLVFKTKQKEGEEKNKRDRN